MRKNRCTLCSQTMKLSQLTANLKILWVVATLITVCVTSTSIQPNCTLGDVRLTNGTAGSDFEELTNAGIVEICVTDTFGRVCNTGWTNRDASVVCRELGFSPYGALAVSSDIFYETSSTSGSGSASSALPLPVSSPVLECVMCNGSEPRLINCAVAPQCSCKTTGYAGVICQNFSTPMAACADGELRLVNGSNQREGRLEICFNRAWGTICGDAFNQTEATVACGQLGFARQDAVIAQFGSRTEDPIFLYHVQCDGTEQQLTDCHYNQFNTNYCDHGSDIGVVCQECDNYDVRLVGGASESYGRVEICYGGKWGTVCDDFWDNRDAAVVCWQLGFPTQFATAIQSYGGGVGRIILDNVNCTGFEYRLIYCPANYNHNCIHSEDAGVSCHGATDVQCYNDTDIWLTDGSNDLEGRVEICVDEVWGTVCDDFWDNKDATVVCRQLGHATWNATAVQRFGGGNGLIALDNVHCNGTEFKLTDCQANRAHNCIHYEDAGVICQRRVCNDTDIRLVGENDYEGRVEICTGGVWGRVCDDRWDHNDAAVVCRQLGYPGVAYGLQEFGGGIGPIVQSNVRCNGTESKLADCLASGTHNCGHYQDAGAICCRAAGAECCNNTDVRLVNKVNNFQGRVEVCVNGRWGTVCDNEWNEVDAAVACRQLGYSTWRPRPLTLEIEDSLVVLENLDCHGTESKLIECSEGDHSICENNQTVGVICRAGFDCNDSDIRLVNGSNMREGVVEICFDGVWGTVCASGLDDLTASVICRWLGFPHPEAEAVSYSRGSSPTLLTGIQCDGMEDHPLDCRHSEVTVHDCLRQQDAGVVCRASPTAQSTPAGQVAIAIPLGIVGSIVFIIVAAVLICIIILRRRRKIKSKEPMLMSDLSSYRTRTATRHHTYFVRGMRTESFLPEAALEELTKATAAYADQLPEDMLISSYNLRLLDAIGTGEFGVVYKAHLINSKPGLKRKISRQSILSDSTMPDIVAVKTLKGFYDKKEVMEIMTESMKMKEFEHPHVLGLIGVCIDAGPAPYIVMPFMANGSLLSYLRKERPNLLLDETADEDLISETQKRLLDMCIQIAKGMEYLANKKIVHKDLAARNCMIDAQYVLKVADFGLSEAKCNKDYVRQQMTSEVKLPIKWMAPESINDGIFSEKTDVWSFGVTCWEVYSTGKTPYPGTHPANIVELIERGERLHKPQNAACSESMYSLMLDCWQAQPKDRPSFSELASNLSSLLEPLADYLCVGTFKHGECTDGEVFGNEEASDS